MIEEMDKICPEEGTIDPQIPDINLIKSME
jgi:hypothetical protein